VLLTISEMPESYGIGGVSMGLTYYQGVGCSTGLILGKSSYAEISLGYDFTITEKCSGSVGARAGYADWDGGGSGFSDYDISASLSRSLSEKWSAGASIAHIGQGDDKVLPDYASPNRGYDVEVVGVFSLTCDM